MVHLFYFTLMIVESQSRSAPFLKAIASRFNLIGLWLTSYHSQVQKTPQERFSFFYLITCLSYHTRKFLHISKHSWTGCPYLCMKLQISNLFWHPNQCWKKVFELLKRMWFITRLMKKTWWNLTQELCFEQWKKCIMLLFRHL
jgi:hypothetical protein